MSTTPSASPRAPEFHDDNSGVWRRDVLGDSWVARTLHVGCDEEGAVNATLVRRAAGPRHRRAVLAIHGFVDYFFQEHQAEFFESLGFDFYAIDLRKYGRSLRPEQTPNYVTELADYRRELEAAQHIIREEEGHDLFVVLGHSTGGLIASLWANVNDSIDGVILNSPWFDLNKPQIVTWFVDLVMPLVARCHPRRPVGALAPHYGRALHRDSGGQWDYDLTWKPHDGFPVRAAWLMAIRRGHHAIRRGLHLPMPVLVLSSTRSGSATRFHEELLMTDSVLRVEHILDGAERLGRDVTVAQVDEGAHDLSLSQSEKARQAYYDHIAAWLTDRGFLAA